MDTINLARFDSTAGKQALEDALKRYATNTMLQSNVSFKVNFNDEFYTYDRNVLADYKGFLSQFLIKIKCPEEYYYHPDYVAKVIYGSVDLWYLVMMFNPIPSVAEFTLPYIYIYNPSKMEYINKILNTHLKELKMNKNEIPKVEKHILKPVRVKDTRLL